MRRGRSCLFAQREGIFDLMNHPYQPLVMTAQKQKSAPIAGLELTVIGPFARGGGSATEEVEEVSKESVTATLATRRPTTSPASLRYASLAASGHFSRECQRRRDLDGLKEKDLLEARRFHIRPFKLPHHGSQNNVTKEFLSR